MKKIKLISVITALLLCLSFAGCSLTFEKNEEVSVSETADTSSETAYEETSSQTEKTETEAVSESVSEEQTSENTVSEEQTSAEAATLTAGNSVSASFSPYTGGVLETDSLFTDRDLLQTPDLTDAEYITVSDGQTIDITTAGVYVLSGSASECTVKVNADSEDKVQLVLNGVTITNSSTPAIYVISADKCFITTAEGTVNTLSVTGTFTADGDTNTDAVIFAKDDLVFGGLGTLNISSTGNGISGKDDVKFTGGTYNITASKHGVEANDSIAVCGGTFTIKAGKDGLHAENDDDNTLGYIYIADGKFTITASSDGIHATTVVQIDGGDITVTAGEGIEGTYIQINDGNIDISSTDDGINAGRKSSSYNVVIEFNGGYTKVAVSQGDTDAIDSNGNIIVNGGTIDITSTMSSFDYDGTAQYNGGTIIINGQTVNGIPQASMGGGMGGQMGGQQGGFGGWGRRG